jgi:hypothetical protein
MSNNYRNGAFALGLVVGGGITLNLFLWLDYRTQHQAYLAANTQDKSNYSQVGIFWDGLIGTFVSPSDTLAQWIMAVFTIAATIVLVFTLRSTNKTNLAAIKASNAAFESNQIMLKEQRPWIEASVRPCGKIVYNTTSKSVVAPFHVTLRNRGKSPALDVTMEGKIKIIRREKFDGGIRFREEINNIAPVVVDEALATRKRYVGHVIFPDGELTYRQRNLHAKLDGEMLADDEEFELIAVVAIVYSTGGAQVGGAIFNSLLSHKTDNPAKKFSLDAIRGDGQAFEITGETFKYF